MTLRWGMIGGGKGSQIGEPHRIAARIDGLFSLTAGAFDIDAEKARSFAQELGVAALRSYGDWKEMLTAEKAMPADLRLDLITIATPNSTHFEITKAFLEAGFNVLCEKPLTMEVAEAEELCHIAAKSGKICGVNFGYSGYPMTIQAREMIRHGDLGDIRVVVAEFAHGFHAIGDDATNPRARWRYDPAQAGISAVVADCGIHAMHMAEFMTGQRITDIAAHFDRGVASRQLEDDAILALRFDGKTVGRVWTSAIATGSMHGFNIRVFGSKGGLRWSQEFPNQLIWSPINQPTQTLERSAPYLYPEAAAGGRIAVGHAEGMLVAFANIYRALSRNIKGEAKGGFPTVEDGANMVRAVHAAVKSDKAEGAWKAL